MTSISPHYLRFTRNYSVLDSLKIFHNLRRSRGLLKSDYRPALAVQSLLLRRFPVISTANHCSSGGLSVAVRFSRMSSGGGDGHQMVEFQLSESSVLKIQKGDITAWSVDGSSDAIVNPANERMLGGGGADGAIHQAAGPELRAACYEVPEVRPGVRCPTGEARITRGFRLPASHVIHTVGPIYDINKNPEASLRNAYRNSLRVAKDNNIQYIAFTAISCGVYRYPYDEAATVAISTVKEFAKDFKEFPLTLLGGWSIAKFLGCLTGKSSSSSINEVHFILFSDEIYNVWLSKANEMLQKC